MQCEFMAVIGRKSSRDSSMTVLRSLQKTEEESPSPASFTFEGNIDNQIIPFSCSEPSEVFASSHLSAPYIPLKQSFKDGNLVSSHGSSGISPDLTALEPLPTCPPMHVLSGGTCSEPSKPFPDTLCSSNELDFTSGSLSHMALPGIGEEFCELSTPVQGGSWANSNVAGPRSDYHSVVSSTSGLTTSATTPLPPPFTTAPMPDYRTGYQ
ncbi:MAG: hypothetical protein Q9195_005265 [Heterodermia aff. obscurata]